VAGGRLGFAEDASPPPAPAAPTQEGLQLNMAFTRISDPKLRRRILELVKGLATDSASAGM